MTWTRTDDTAPHHPKQLRAGAEACWLWQSGLCYSNAHKLDGKIHKDLLPVLYPPLARKAAKLAAKLCEVRLWHDRGDHFEIHDYAQYQDAAMKVQVEARREYERERKRRQRHGNVPDSVPDSPGDSPAGQLREGKGRIGKGRGSNLPGSTTPALEPVPPTGNPEYDSIANALELKQPVRVVR